MIHFMIDFENIGNRGLLGAEYLCADDSVTIFYSKTCMKIEQGKINQLKEAKCDLELCKLQKTGKNALDFYIASRIGEVYGRGYGGLVAIVSNDTGFQAVREYWKSCTTTPRNVILRGDIEHCILSSGENSPRQRQISQKKKEVNLEEEYRKYTEQQRIRKMLENDFANTDYEDMIERVMKIIEPRKSLKLLYLDSVKQFGRRDGLGIYHRVKRLV